MSPRVVAAVLAAALAAVAPALGAGGPAKTYSAHGVTFRYPAGWYRLRSGRFSAEAGNTLWSQWLAPAPRGADLVIVSAYRSAVSITRATVERYRPMIAAAITQPKGSLHGR